MWQFLRFYWFRLLPSCNGGCKKGHESPDDALRFQNGGVPLLAGRGPPAGACTLRGADEVLATFAGLSVHLHPKCRIRYKTGSLVTDFVSNLHYTPCIHVNV